MKNLFKFAWIIILLNLPITGFSQSLTPIQRYVLDEHVPVPSKRGGYFEYLTLDIEIPQNRKIEKWERRTSLQPLTVKDQIWEKAVAIFNPEGKLLSTTIDTYRGEVRVKGIQQIFHDSGKDNVKKWHGDTLTYWESAHFDSSGALQLTEFTTGSPPSPIYRRYKYCNDTTLVRISFTDSMFLDSSKIVITANQQEKWCYEYFRGSMIWYYYYCYDENGQELSFAHYDDDGTISSHSISEYDEGGRFIASNYYHGSDTSAHQKKTCRYDARGREIYSVEENPYKKIEIQTTYKDDTTIIKKFHNSKLWCTIREISEAHKIIFSGIDFGWGEKGTYFEYGRNGLVTSETEVDLVYGDTLSQVQIQIDLNTPEALKYIYFADGEPDLHVEEKFIYREEEK